MSSAKSSSGGEPKLEAWLQNNDDYTYYVSRYSTHAPKDADGREVDLSRRFDDYAQLLADAQISEEGFSASCTRRIRQLGVNETDLDSSNSARLLVCKAYAGEAIAVTARRLEKPKKLDQCSKIQDPQVWIDGECGYVKSPDPAEMPFAVPIDAVCDELEWLFLSTSVPSGLILVAGATNSAKSELTRGIIARLIKAQLRKKPERWPHLITYEDPIEKWLFKNSTASLTYGVEYTPRQKGIDVGSLGSAFDDALRQTPSVFYVGEVREDNDWKELMRFAGTGHLVVATAHAGSLVEAMERIFRGMKARTAADRGQIAGRILAGIHQRKFDLAKGIRETAAGLETPVVLSEQFKFEVLLPSVWQRTPAGVAALVSDGLGSVLPNKPSNSDANVTSSRGRQYFAHAFRDNQRWFELFVVDLLGSRLSRQIEQEMGTLRNKNHEAAQCWTKATVGDRKWKACAALAYLVVRLRRKQRIDENGLSIDLAILDELSGRIKADAQSLDPPQSITILIWNALAAARVRLESHAVAAEWAVNAALSEWLRTKVISPVVHDRSSMEQPVADAEKAEKDIGWARGRSPG